MSRELVKVIIEVRGGLVQAVYCGAEEAPLAEFAIIDHDAHSVAELPPQPLSQLDADDAKAYDCDPDAKWVFE